MKLSRFTWRVLLAAVCFGATFWSPMARADETNCPYIADQADICPLSQDHCDEFLYDYEWVDAPETLANEPQADEQDLIEDCPFRSVHDAIYDAEVYGFEADGNDSAEECIEKITVIHSKGQQSVEIVADDSETTASEPEVAAVADTEDFSYEDEADSYVDQDYEYESYEYDYYYEEDVESASADDEQPNAEHIDNAPVDVANSAETDDGQVATDESQWDEYGAYDEYDYDEYYYENYAPEGAESQASKSVEGEPTDAPSAEIAETEAQQPQAIEPVTNEAIEAPGSEVVESDAIEPPMPEVVENDAIEPPAPEIVEIDEVEVPMPEVAASDEIEPPTPEVVENEVIEPPAPEVVENEAVEAPMPEIVESDAIEPPMPEVVESDLVEAPAPEVAENDEIRMPPPVNDELIEDSPMPYDEYGYDEYSVDETDTAADDDYADYWKGVEVTGEESTEELWGEGAADEAEQDATAESEHDEYDDYWAEESEASEPTAKDTAASETDLEAVEQALKATGILPLAEAIVGDISLDELAERLPEPANTSDVAESSASDDECDREDPDRSDEFEGEEVQEVAKTEAGGSLRFLERQALQILAASVDHAGRTLQNVSHDLMRISNSNVAKADSKTQLK